MTQPPLREPSDDCAPTGATSPITASAVQLPPPPPPHEGAIVGVRMPSTVPSVHGSGLAPALLPRLNPLRDEATEATTDAPGSHDVRDAIHDLMRQTIPTHVNRFGTPIVHAPTIPTAELSREEVLRRLAAIPPMPLLRASAESDFKLDGTTTGRFDSSKPNPSNTPRPTYDPPSTPMPMDGKPLGADHSTAGDHSGVRVMTVDLHGEAVPTRVFRVAASSEDHAHDTTGTAALDTTTPTVEGHEALLPARAKRRAVGSLDPKSGYKRAAWSKDEHARAVMRAITARSIEEFCEAFPTRTPEALAHRLAMAARNAEMAAATVADTTLEAAYHYALTLEFRDSGVAAQLRAIAKYLRDCVTALRQRESGDDTRAFAGFPGLSKVWALLVALKIADPFPPLDAEGWVFMSRVTYDHAATVLVRITRALPPPPFEAPAEPEPAVQPVATPPVQSPTEGSFADADRFLLGRPVIGPYGRVLGVVCGVNDKGVHTITAEGPQSGADALPAEKLRLGVVHRGDPVLNPRGEIVGFLDDRDARGLHVATPLTPATAPSPAPATVDASGVTPSAVTGAVSGIFDGVQRLLAKVKAMQDEAVTDALDRFRACEANTADALATLLSASSDLAAQLVPSNAGAAAPALDTPDDGLVAVVSAILVSRRAGLIADDSAALNLIAERVATLGNAARRVQHATTALRLARDAQRSAEATVYALVRAEGFDTAGAGQTFALVIPSADPVAIPTATPFPLAAG